MSTAFSAVRSRSAALTRLMPASGWTIAIAALSLAAWLGALMFMADMDEGPGTPLHDLPAFLVGWIIMLTAMMLPSELSFIGAFIALLKSRSREAVADSRIVACFMAGYGVAWIGYGLAAYILDAMVRGAGLEVLSWVKGGPFLAGGVLVVAGLYQISPLKQACLTHCRTPLAFFARRWREGAAGALAMGARHGLVCVGCCWALMAVMFAVGAMSLTWMALLTLPMFAEKILPHGQRLSVPIACFLWIMGVWIAVSPDTAPLLKDPMLFGASLCRGF